MGDTSMNWFCSKTLIFMLILLSGLGMLYHQCPLFYYLASVIQNSNSRSGFYSYPAYIDMMFKTQVILNNDLQIKFMFHSGWPTLAKITAHGCWNIHESVLLLIYCHSCRTFRSVKNIHTINPCTQCFHCMPLI